MKKTVKAIFAIIVVIIIIAGASLLTLLALKAVFPVLGITISWQSFFGMAWLLFLNISFFAKSFRK